MIEVVLDQFEADVINIKMSKADAEVLADVLSHESMTRIQYELYAALVDWRLREK